MSLFSTKNSKEQEDENQDALVALDIGSSKLRLISGEITDEGILAIKYYAERNSAGMENGAITDLSKLSDKITQLISDYKANGHELTHCYMGIAGRYIKSANLQGGAVVATHVVEEADRVKAIEDAAAKRFSDYQRIIHIIPQGYQIGDTREITNPIGLNAQRLDVSVHVISCDEDQEQNLRSVMVQVDNDINVDHVIFNGIAASDAVLSEEDKAIGVCLVDWGGGAINVSIYDKSSLIHTFGLDYGGSRITRDIATRFGLPLATAEYLKCNFGVAHPNLLEQKLKDTLLKVPLDPQNADDYIYISYYDLAQTIAISMIDTMAQILLRIDNFRRSQNFHSTLGAGYIFTGGVAKTQGLVQLAKSKMSDNGVKPKVKIGKPRSVIGDFNQTEGEQDSAANAAILDPSCATAIGLLRFGYALKDEERLLHNQSEHKTTRGPFSKIYHWTRNWLSGEL